MILRDCSEFLVRGGGWSFSEKVPVKNAYPPPRSLRKILVPPSEMLSKKGTPPLRVPETFHGSRGESHERGILLCSVSFFCVCKKWISPPWSLCKILVPPPRKPCQKRVPPLAKGPPPLTRNSEQS